MIPVIVRLYPPKKLPVFGDIDDIIGVTWSEYVIMLLIVCIMYPSFIYKLYGPNSVLLLFVILLISNIISYPLNVI